MLMLLCTNRRIDLGEPSLLPMDWQILQQSAVRVRSEMMDTFVTQTMDSFVEQIEGQVCSKPFWEKLGSVLGQNGCSKAASLVA
jgi:hypothetical protein